MFDFRIINLSDGNQIINRNLKTPYEVLTPLQFLEYTDIEIQLYIADRIHKKEAERQRKLARNPLYKIACLCGLA